MPPGTKADTSPGTVFLFAAMWASSITRSTLEPSTPWPCKKNSSVTVKKPKCEKFSQKFFKKVAGQGPRGGDRLDNSRELGGYLKSIIGSL